MFIPIYKLGCVFLLGLHAFLFVSTVCCLAGIALTFTTAFCCSFSRPLMKLAQLMLSQNLCNSLSKNEGPNRLRPQSLTRPRVKCLVLSHPPGASVVFPCPYFLLPWALLSVLSLLLPLQMKGPTLVLTLRLIVSLLESFQLCPAIFG
jgi:hypothetical protein